MDIINCAMGGFKSLKVQLTNSLTRYDSFASRRSRIRFKVTVLLS
jgi:hypothetical protein